MKRDSWVPSKYQFLCSDHFTPDSLDIRWGIRYLKQTAIPTIFPLPEDCQGKDPSKKKSQKKKLEDENEVCLKTKSEKSFTLNETKKNIINTDVLPERADLVDSYAVVNPAAPNAGGIQNNILTLNLIAQDNRKAQSTLKTSVNQDSHRSGFHTSFENQNSTTITMTTSNSEDIQQFLETQKILEITTNHLNPNLTNNSMEISSQENPFLFSTISSAVEDLNKESLIAIFVPTENLKPVDNSFIPTQKETMEMEDISIDDSLYKDVDHGAEVLQIDHSYCRQDINKEHLWQKVSKLHSKITLLELQEQKTLGRLKSLEALINQLKQENWLSEENVKIIENHFTTYEVTMI
ncbi:THAP domain-containing protein 5 isoform X2 [Octodon degus]|nr:THAP domain-containing protein 5 isoform X2 [Octodon degus]